MTKCPKKVLLFSYESSVVNYTYIDGKECCNKKYDFFCFDKIGELMKDRIDWSIEKVIIEIPFVYSPFLVWYG